ncbi:UNVERIFIED_CONTAM: hypothetical protein NCL1_44887 [Trichonephila clavipes]
MSFRIFPLCYLGVECRMLSQHILLEFLLRTVESWSSVAHFVFHEEGKASLGTGRYLSYSLPATSGFEIILPKTGKSRVCPDGKLAPRANVISGQHFLHQIQANEFLDSPEFESSRSGVEEKFKVSVFSF